MVGVVYTDVEERWAVMVYIRQVEEKGAHHAHVERAAS